jgi:hypothetical protein
MDITALPNELLRTILEYTVELNEHDGVAFSYGLHHNLSMERNPPLKFSRHVRGPLPPYQQRWDAAATLRLVCRKWHDWALDYALGEVYVKNWIGAEKWCDLTMERGTNCLDGRSKLTCPVKYPLYELIGNPKGLAIRRGEHTTLENTRRFLEACPSAAASVRRLWFNGLYLPSTDAEVVASLRACSNLQSATVPWTLVRHATAADWAAILRADGDSPLNSLELHAVTQAGDALKAIREAPDRNPLRDPLVDFSQLRRLKLFGNTNALPICDADLYAIARTATNLEEFQLTCMSTVSIDGTPPFSSRRTKRLTRAGVMAIVRASRKTLRVLEHSPRADSGFANPHPGVVRDGAHACALIAACPRLADVSVSLPTMCADLFAGRQARWTGGCQVRARGLCGHGDARKPGELDARGRGLLRGVLDAARGLVAARATVGDPQRLTVELFFAGLIFDPHARRVHGDFRLAAVMSGGTWPVEAAPSGKGPYGSSGLYGKMEEGVFECVSEQELWVALQRGFVDMEDEDEEEDEE